MNSVANKRISGFDLVRRTARVAKGISLESLGPEFRRGESRWGQYARDAHLTLQLYTQQFIYDVYDVWICRD